MNRIRSHKITSHSIRSHASCLSIVAALAFAGACVPMDGSYDRGPCEDDTDCSGASVCANTRECLPATSVHPVFISWTVYGAPADEQTCAPIPELRVTFENYQYTSDNITYRPVLCAQGQINFTRIPLRFEGINVTAHDPVGSVLDNSRAPLPGGDVRLDIDFQP